MIQSLIKMLAAQNILYKFHCIWFQCCTFSAGPQSAFDWFIHQTFEYKNMICKSLWNLQVHRQFILQVDLIQIILLGVVSSVFNNKDKCL